MIFQYILINQFKIKKCVVIFAYTVGFIWSITFISIGYFLSEKWFHASRQVHQYIAIGSCIFFVILLVYFFVQSFFNLRFGLKKRIIFIVLS